MVLGFDGSTLYTGNPFKKDRKINQAVKPAAGSINVNNIQQPTRTRDLRSPVSAPWRIHLTPGLGPRLPLTATAAEVTQMEADGLLRVAISAEEAVGQWCG